MEFLKGVYLVLCSTFVQGHIGADCSCMPMVVLFFHLIKILILSLETCAQTCILAKTGSLPMQNQAKCKSECVQLTFFKSKAAILYFSRKGASLDSFAWFNGFTKTYQRKLQQIIQNKMIRFIFELPPREHVTG